MCVKQTANLLSLGTHVCCHVVRSSFARSLFIISSRDCREADSRDTSPRHACLGEVSRKIWLHDFAINNNAGSIPVIFISLVGSNFQRGVIQYGGLGCIPLFSCKSTKEFKEIHWWKDCSTRTQEITEEHIAAKIEDILQKEKDFRKPRTRKKKEGVIKFLDDCGRPISKRPTRRRHQTGQRQHKETGNPLETYHSKATSAHTIHHKYPINNQLQP